MYRLRWLVAMVFVVCASFGVLTAFSACTDDTIATTFIPETGITVQSASLTNGIGCGTADAEVYKYVALAIDNDSNVPSLPGNDQRKVVVAGLFDCYVDAYLVNLPATETGAADYQVRILAWDKRSFDTNAAQITSILTTTLEPGVSEPTVDQSVPHLEALNPTYETLCSASEVTNIQAVATCPPLTPVGLLNEDGGSLDDAGTADAGDSSANDSGDSGDGSITDGSFDSSDAQDASSE